MEYFWTTDGTHVPCTGRWILIHSATKEVQHACHFLNEFSGISIWQIMCSLSVEEEKHSGQEWVVCVCFCVCVQSLTHAWSYDGSLPGSSVWDFSGKDTGVLAFPSPGDLPDPGIELTSPVPPALQMDSFTAEPPRKPRNDWWFLFVSADSLKKTTSHICLTLKCESKAIKTACHILFYAKFMVIILL